LATANTKRKDYSTIRVGASFKAKVCGDYTIVKVYGGYVDVIFTNTGHIKTKVQKHHIISGSINDPLHQSIFGRGFTGVGSHSKCTRAGRIWYSMFKRCYSGIPQYSSYIGCEVSETWYNFQNFAEWYYANYKEGFELDKDIKGGRCYSAENCVFIPSDLNKALILHKSSRGTCKIGVHKRIERKLPYQVCCNFGEGVVLLGYFSSEDEAFCKYKEAKEGHVRALARTYWQEGGITKETYDILAEYTISGGE
jgi:hypothetical protein